MMKSNGYIWLAKLYLEVKIFTQRSVGNRRLRADEIATVAASPAVSSCCRRPAKLAERRRCSTEEKEKVREVKVLYIYTT